MDNGNIKEFAIDYMVMLTGLNGHAGMHNQYYGVIVYENSKIDLTDIFFCGYLGRHSIEQRTEEYIQTIDSFSKYLEERNEDSLIRKDEKPIAYIHIPEILWDALYWGCREYDDPKLIKFLNKSFDKFMKEHDMEYDLTEYGRNSILVYYHGED